jgi:hypothetical protein
MFHEQRFPIAEATERYSGGYSISISNDGNCIKTDFGNILWLENNISKIMPLSLEQQGKKWSTTTVLNPDGSHITGYVSDHWEHVPSIRLWDTRSGKLIQEYHWKSEFPFDRPKSSVELHFRDHGRQLVALTSLGEVAIWSTINGNLLRFVGGSSIFSSGMVISHDTNWFISLDRNPKQLGRNSHLGYVSHNLLWKDRLYGYKSHAHFERARESAHLPSGYSSHIFPIGMTQVGELEPVVFKIWDSYSGAPIRDLELPKVEEDIRYSYNFSLQNFQLSHDDTLLASEFNKSILVWDLNSSEIIQTITHSERLTLIGFSQDDRFLIYHDVSQINIWDIEMQDWIGTHPIEGEIRRATISDTNRVAATVWNGEYWEIAVIDLNF